jgi:Fur family ferric uptake transcriptional regulator
MDGQERILRFLESRNLRSTAGRRAMVREILALGKRHYSAEDLVARFRRRGESVSRATIYRTLDHLVSGGFLRRLSLGHRHSLFESNLGHRHHEHLICLKCGEVSEFNSEALERLLSRLCRRRQFRPLRRAFQIFGWCGKCARTRLS